MRAFITLALLGAADASLLSAPRSRPLRFRGGDDDGDGEPATKEYEPLTEEQVLEKLNEVPTFVVMSGKDDGGFVALQVKDGGRAICFFTEPEEAKAVLNMTMSAEPGTPLRLACIGLGNALKLCGGLGEDVAKAAFAEFDGDLKLQGFHALVEEVTPQLRTMLGKAGIEEGAWLLPVFLCEELSSEKLFPVFLNPREIHTAWAEARKSQGLEEAAPPNKYGMMDIRMLVADMQKKLDVPWSNTQLIGAAGAAELANELLDQSDAPEL